MSCFDNIITVKGGCSDVAPLSGYYINDLVSLDELNSFVGSDYVDGEALGISKIQFAINQISGLVYNHFSNKFKANSLLDGMRIGFPSDNMVLKSGIANTYKGINTELSNSLSFLDEHISSISLQVDVTQNVSVLVYNLLTGLLLDTIVVPTIAGKIVTVAVGKKYESDRRKLNLSFVYDSTGINSYTTTINNTNGCSSCGGNQYSNSHLSYRGISIPTASQMIKSNLNTIGDTGGLSIVYSVSCNHKEWLCTFANLLSLPILYKAGAEIMEYARLQSKRVNSNTFIDLEKLKERQDLYELKYRELMDGILQNLKLPTDSLCYECNPRSRHTIILP